MESERDEIVILGGGLMGSSVAWQLTRSGENVLLLEQQDQEYVSGSSLGETRICRSLGPKNDLWSYLHRRTVTEVQLLIDFLNEKDSVNHSMDDIYTTSPVTYLFQTEKKEVIRRMLRQQEDDYVFISSPEEAEDQFDLTLSQNQVLIQEYREYSGTINPVALISKLHTAIRLCGGKVRYERTINQVRKLENGFQITSTNKTGLKETIQAKRIVSALGPYTGSVLAEFAPQTQKLITPKRVPLAFFSIEEDCHVNYSAEQKQKIFNFFPFIDLGRNHVFSMIEKMKNDIPLIKIGGHFMRTDVENIDEVWSKSVTKEEIEWSKEQLLNYFSQLNIPLTQQELIYQRGYSCVYSLTENEVPIVDVIEQNCVLMGGFSGVGGKGALAYGLIASHLLSGKSEEGVMYEKVRGELKMR